MKKIILFLICLVFIPTVVGAYYSDEQFRLDIIDYLRDQSYKQAQDEILQDQVNLNKQYLDTYYQSINGLEKDYELKLRALELEQESAKRAKDWEKEKQLLDQELELARQKAEFEAQKKAFETQKNSEDLVQYMRGVTDQIMKDRTTNEEKYINSESKRIKPFQYETSTNNEKVSVTEDIKPTEEVTPKKNIFKKFWLKVLSFFQ